MKRTIIICSLALAVAMGARAQGFVETEYLSTSDMNDKDGVNHGRGDMLRVRGRYTLPLSVKMNERRQPTAWSATLSASYATMNNKGEALSLVHSTRKKCRCSMPTWAEATNSSASVWLKVET